MYDDEYTGEEGFFPAVVPIPCPVGMVWDEHYRRCAPVVMSPPPPIVPIAAGYYTGAPVPGSPEWHDIEPDLFGTDALSKGCSPGMYWDGYYKRCTKMHIPIGPAPVPITSGGYVGQEWHDVEPSLYGADAALKGCGSGMYWDGYYKRCTPAHLPIAPAPFPPTLDEWRRQHRTGFSFLEGIAAALVPGAAPALAAAEASKHHGRHGYEHEHEHEREMREHHEQMQHEHEHRTGWNLFGDVFGWTDPFSGQHAPGHRGEHDRRGEHEHHEQHPFHEHEHREHFTGREWVGAAVAEGEPVTTAAVHAENADVQAKSAQAAAAHPAAKGTSAAKSAQAATTHADLAASHAKAAAAHPSPNVSAAHAQQAVAHAHQAASHAADAHAAIGNSGAGVGTGQHPGTAHPASQAVTHAQNAATQARSAQAAASHPSAKGTQASRYAQSASSHASQAADHARAAAANPHGPGAAYHSQQAAMHTQAAASHAVNAHAALQGRPVRSAPAERGFGRGAEGRRGEIGRREGFGGARRGGMGGRGYRDAYGRFRGRRSFPEWRGLGHPGWRHGVGERWLHHRASCWRRHEWGCAVEQIFDPNGQISYRVTPAGMMENVELAPEEQAANVQYVQTTGEQLPTADDGPMPGSDSSSDGSQAPADEDAKDDAGAAADKGADQGADDQGSDTSDAAADTAAADDSSDDSTNPKVSGEYAGWQDPFTTPYPGFFNPNMPAAWDSHFTYPGFGYDPYSGRWGRRYW